MASDALQASTQDSPAWTPATGTGTPRAMDQARPRRRKPSPRSEPRAESACRALVERRSRNGPPWLFLAHFSVLEGRLRKSSPDRLLADFRGPYNATCRFWRGAGAADRAGLENRCGSNPTE